MIDLATYFHPDNLAAAHRLGPLIRYEEGRLIVPKPLSGLGDGPNLVQLKCLECFLRNPVIVRPPLALCRTLTNTDLPISQAEYRQPWPVLGIEWPEGIGAPRSLTLLWRPDPTRVWIFTPTGEAPSKILHTHFSGPADLDGHLADTPIDGLTQADEATSRHVSRMALNLGLLLTYKSHRLTRLPEHVLRNRRHPDPATRQRAGRQAQLVILKNLDMLLKWQGKRPEVAAEGQGRTLPPQFRRGHWKRVAHGPGHSLRRLDWIEPYWTGVPEDRQPTITVLS